MTESSCTATPSSAWCMRRCATNCSRRKLAAAPAGVKVLTIEQALALERGEVCRYEIAAETAGKVASIPRKAGDEVLTTDHPIDLTRYQVVNCYIGRAGLINSGGASGKNDFGEAAATAVINKRAGGMGLISGRKAFQRPMAEGAALLHAIQDVYLASEITVA